MDENRSSLPERDKPGGKKPVTAMKLFGVVLLLAVVAWFSYQAGQDRQEGEVSALQRELDAELGILPGMSSDEIQDRLNRKVAESRLNISMNPTPVFADGAAEGDVRIENIQGNKYGFIVSITVIGTDEAPGAKDFLDQEILKTGLIEPGKYLEKKRLDVDLPKGIYVCIATFTAYSLETDMEIGSAGMQIVLTVES